MATSDKTYLIFDEDEDELHIGGGLCWCNKYHIEGETYVHFEIDEVRGILVKDVGGCQ